MQPSSIQIRWCSSAADIDPALWHACFPVPLEGQWWYNALEKSGLEDQFTFFYAVVSLIGRAVAIAPGFVMNVPISQVVPPALLPAFTILGKVIPALLVQRTLFIGSPCSDEGAVGILPGIDRAAILLAVQQAMFAKAEELKAPMFAWKDFPARYKDALESIARSEKLFPLVSFPGTEVALPPGGKEAYFASLKGSYRHQLKKKLRRSAEQVRVSTEVIQHPDDQTLDDIFGLFWQNYEKATTKFETLNRAFFSRIAAYKGAYFVIVREKQSGAMLAFMLCFLSTGHVINKFVGIDQKRPKEWLLYFRLWDAAVEWSIAQGAHTIQSGQTVYKPKIETGHKLVALTHYCRHRNPLIHSIYRLFAKSVTWGTLSDDLALYTKAHPEALI